MTDFYKPYYDEYFRLIYPKSIDLKFEEFRKIALKIKNSDGKLIFAGNGASASISAHGAVDFTKQGGVRAVTFNEANVITCFSNDFGYDNWVCEALKFYAKKNDAIVLISVSGESPSVVNAAETAKDLGIPIITFTGRDQNNSLKSLGDVNFWVDSNAYNIVECIHMIWVTTVIDAIIGKAEYEVS
ncbi:MAG: phosphoheptose isomerase [Gammaproteobacteria bacterium]|nr:phosphoheptose isomerase [Gammaproteobacteria bacterium]|tara:strand:+ start:1007 stop:1564 length:558 start_codon:yes stop_codon:yes gene_type:complete